MVTQYPHIIKVTKAQVLQKDADNHWIKPEGEPEYFTSECRAELNISRAKIMGSDGGEIIYLYKIYMPQTTFKGEVNAKVEITLESEEKVSGTLFRWHNGQLNSVAWL